MNEPGRVSRAALLTAALVANTFSFSPAVAGQPVCQSCHDHVVKGSFVHSPVATGDCVSCHRPAAPGSHPGVTGRIILIEKGAKLCYLCHESKATRKYIHSPVAAGDCAACHDPHRSAGRYLLKSDRAMVCLRCHAAMAKHKFSHAPVTSGDCLACHDPHQSDFPHLLKNSVAALCQTCHEKGHFNGTVMHEPVRSGDCTACHDPHGSEFDKGLKSRMSTELYLPYDSGNFALCFDCHNKDLALDLRTETATGFRNGYRNLHTVHVNRPVKGRACKACHDVHATSQDKLVKDKIPGFGKWEIPISYTRTATGGTCVVGCHKPRSYDRFSQDAF